MIRIVKMTFEPRHIEKFLQIFEAAKPKIERFEGCSGVELLQDKTNPAIMMTYSRWKNEAALENYRNSELFRETWKQTKALFATRPEAWSTEKIR